ncbi:MAG: hypothetical protein HQ521_08005 [Bacteroidetes bacterium]|nr:hypothetical protein [Bacteroidota bacterium]
MNSRIKNQNHEKKKLLLLFVVFVFILSSCSDYKKVGFDGQIKYEINRQSSITPSGTESIYTLLGISINGKDLKLKDDSIVVPPNSKLNVETESIGDIKIKIYEGKERSFDVVLWMTEEQISKFK